MQVKGQAIKPWASGATLPKQAGTWQLVAVCMARPAVPAGTIATTCSGSGTSGWGHAWP